MTQLLQAVNQRVLHVTKHSGSHLDRVALVHRTQQSRAADLAHYAAQEGTPQGVGPYRCRLAHLKNALTPVSVRSDIWQFIDYSDDQVYNLGAAPAQLKGWRTLGHMKRKVYANCTSTLGSLLHEQRGVDSQKQMHSAVERNEFSCGLIVGVLLGQMNSCRVT